MLDSNISPGENSGSENKREKGRIKAALGILRSSVRLIGRAWIPLSSDFSFSLSFFPQKHLCPLTHQFLLQLESAHLNIEPEDKKKNDKKFLQAGDSLDELFKLFQWFCFKF